MLAGCGDVTRESAAEREPPTTRSILKVDSPQQHASYTSGPCAARAILRYYGRDYDEFDIAREMRIDDMTDTPPDRLEQWLENHAFTVTWGENGSIAGLCRDIDAGHPVLVEWRTANGAHWATVIGYDRHGTADPLDDELIFADPAAGADHPDGRTQMQARDFDALWQDTKSFAKPVTRVFITAVAAPPAR
jgi:hypothetical protein